MTEISKNGSERKKNKNESLGCFRRTFSGVSIQILSSPPYICPHLFFVITLVVPGQARAFYRRGWLFVAHLPQTLTPITRAYVINHAESIFNSRIDSVKPIRLNLD